MAEIIGKEIAKEIASYPNKTPQQEKLTLSCSEAAKLLGVSTTTPSKLIRENKIPSIRYYRKILIPYIALKKQFSEMSNGSGN
jgi:excisionase family DNA binding protein